MYDYLKNKTVLYIEDEIDVLRNISTLLRNFFAQIYIAADGETGLEIYQAKEIDLLLVDIELPKMNGIEFIKKVRSINQDIPIVVISAYTKTDYLLESVELNLEKYIVKPFTTKKIHQLLNNLNSDFEDQNIKILTPEVTLDYQKSTVCYLDKEISLTKRELHFLSILARKKVIYYDEVISLWENGTPSENAIRSCIKKLRKKLPNDFLKTRNRIGYYIEGQG